MIPSAIKPFLEPVWKFRSHCIEIVLITIAIILTGVCIGLAPFVGRGDIMVIAIVSLVHLPQKKHPLMTSKGVKSILFIAYQIVTERSTRYRKWASLKANVVLNSIEIPFWLVVIILKFMGVSTFCSGSSCGVSVIIGLVAIVIFVIVLQVAAISWIDWLHFKRNGVERGAPAAGTPSYAEAYYANSVPK
jgi:hypothetical protein